MYKKIVYGLCFATHALFCMEKGAACREEAPADLVIFEQHVNNLTRNPACLQTIANLYATHFSAFANEKIDSSFKKDLENVVFLCLTRHSPLRCNVIESGRRTSPDLRKTMFLKKMHQHYTATVGALVDISIKKGMEDLLAEFQDNMPALLEKVRNLEWHKWRISPLAKQADPLASVYQAKAGQTGTRAEQPEVLNPYDPAIPRDQEEESLYL